jgi:hypothetical protein
MGHGIYFIYLHIIYMYVVTMSVYLTCVRCLYIFLVYAFQGRMPSTIRSKIGH